MLLASQAQAAGSTGLAILIISVIVILFTFIDVEFGIYCLVAGMLLSPEIEVPYFTLPSRAVVVRIDDIMIILVGIAWFAQVAVRGKIDLLVSTPLNKPILWFLFLAGLSTARGSFTGSVGHPVTAFFFVLKFIEFFTLYFLIVNTIANETQVKRIMTVYFMTVLCVSLWAIWHTLITREHGRSTTPFETAEEPGTLGGYLLFSFALAFGLLNYVGNLFQRMMYLLIMMVIIPPFLYTLSRASYLAFFPMFLTVLYFSRRKAIPVMMLIAFAAASPWLPGVAIERVEYTFQNRVERTLYGTAPTLGEQLDPSSAARLERYDGVIRQWMHRPLLGQGMTGVGFVDSQFVRVLGEFGILGSLAFIWIFKNLFQTAIKLYRALDVGYMKGLVLGMLAGTVGLIFHGGTANTFTVVRIAGPFFVMTGLTIVISRIHQREIEALET
jgi:hypothetical protein